MFKKGQALKFGSAVVTLTALVWSATGASASDVAQAGANPIVFDQTSTTENLRVDAFGLDGKRLSRIYDGAAGKGPVFVSLAGARPSRSGSGVVLVCARTERGIQKSQLVHLEDVGP